MPFIQVKLQIKDFEVPTHVSIQAPAQLRQEENDILKEVHISELTKTAVIDLCRNFSKAVLDLHKAGPID